MNLKQKFFILISLFLVIFFYGIGVGLYKWFPFFTLQAIKQKIDINENHVIEKISSLDTSIVREHTNLFNSKSLLLKREKLLKLVTKEINSSDILTEPINKNSKKIMSNIYGINTNAILTFSSNSNNCLRIYIQGHGGNPFHYSYHNKLMAKFLEDGCDVLSMSMTGLGLNKGQASYPSKFGKVMLNKEMAKEHSNYSFFFDKDNPELDPLSLFITPHYNIINFILKKDYQNISLMGISGGGWYTVWLSALLPKIDLSISYAGSLPMEYRKFFKNRGDWEQQYSQVYNFVSYWELYKLMTLDSDGNSTRRAINVYNDKDDVAFPNPYAKHFKLEADRLNWKNFEVIINNSKKHLMDVNLIKNIFTNK
jgi:hypothetical protein